MALKLEVEGTPNGTKNDAGKVPLELLPFDALTEVAKVLQFGACKYAPRNWENGISYGRVFAAAMGHLWSWFCGEDKDPETGLSHLAHAACDVLFLLAYVLRSAAGKTPPTALDDRAWGSAPVSRAPWMAKHGADATVAALVGPSPVVASVGDTVMLGVDPAAAEGSATVVATYENGELQHVETLTEQRAVPLESVVPARAFKVGDRVRADYNGRQKVGTIDEKVGVPYHVDLGRLNGLWCNVDDLELVEPAAG